MKILLDEGVPDFIKHRLSSFSIFTVKEMAWRGVKNGLLLDSMAGEFQILITTDKNLPHQQSLKKRKISVIILPANDIPTVIDLMPQIADAIDTVSQVSSNNWLCQKRGVDDYRTNHGHRFPATHAHRWLRENQTRNLHRSR